MLYVGRQGRGLFTGEKKRLIRERARSIFGKKRKYFYVKTILKSYNGHQTESFVRFPILNCSGERIRGLGPRGGWEGTSGGQSRGRCPGPPASGVWPPEGNEGGCAATSGASPQPKGTEATGAQGSAPSRLQVAPGSGTAIGRGRREGGLARLTPGRWVCAGQRGPVTGRDPEGEAQAERPRRLPVSIPSVSAR